MRSVSRDDPDAVIPVLLSKDSNDETKSEAEPQESDNPTKKKSEKMAWSMLEKQVGFIVLSGPASVFHIFYCACNMHSSHFET